jgi:hypothetical protein
MFSVCMYMRSSTAILHALKKLISQYTFEIDATAEKKPSTFAVPFYNVGNVEIVIVSNLF